MKSATEKKTIIVGDFNLDFPQKDNISTDMQTFSRPWMKNLLTRI